MTNKRERNALLRKAKKLVAKGWRQDHWATNADGSVPQFSEDVIEKGASFCAWGAVQYLASSNRDLWQASEYALDKAAEARGAAGVISYNEEPMRTQAEILSLYDDAMRLPL